jgi:anti-anti-sigma factor
VINIETMDTIAIIKISGDFSLEIGTFKDFIDDCSNNINYNKIILDFSFDVFITSSIIGYLINLVKNNKNKLFMIVGEESNMDNTIKAMNLQNIFKIHYSLKNCLLDLSNER